MLPLAIKMPLLPTNVFFMTVSLRCVRVRVLALIGRNVVRVVLVGVPPRSQHICEELTALHLCQPVRKLLNA
eukprot:5340989-Prorocentrum_lima.AAC.1